jgi:hypothetical protein
MKVSRRSVGVILVVLLAGMLFNSGCAYLQNRGNDALDIFDVGITTSEEPQFALYAGFLNIAALGYSNVDGTLAGIGHRNVGVMQVRHHAAGILVYGDEQFGYDGDYNAADPNSPEPWRVGIVGLMEGPGPRNGQVVNCPKLLHLGWLGLTLNCKFGELADFILGLTTLDIMSDDRA